MMTISGVFFIQRIPMLQDGPSIWPLVIFMIGSCYVYGELAVMQNRTALYGGHHLSRAELNILFSSMPFAEPVCSSSPLMYAQ